MLDVFTEKLLEIFLLNVFLQFYKIKSLINDCIPDFQKYMEKVSIYHKYSFGNTEYIK